MSGGPENGGGLSILGRLLCLLGMHDFKVVSRTFGFGGGGAVEQVECRRCGHVTARQPDG